ncbi:flagellar regulatory protein FliZ [Providencia rettgeri DSM 1131]|uniref:flagella biosynthesis regulatory protein FliZ n=1 Tax=Providencia rettgeri TaxID=587 RepID=UPI000197CA7C|nr:flagella biosynthesis regulatory protein FliZ [Providencia rettgeri]EFE54087.1 flagellar regulatory protein FliZ [Providencia rettgeri DSM 1131]QXA57386.1 flagella biosynthesis regulatory protein FliZ [Providencia rettgeri]
MKLYPLKSYLRDYKVQKTHCANCDKRLDRAFMVLNGKIVTRKDIANLTVRVDQQAWHDYQKTLVVLCRFCSVIYSDVQPQYFDLWGFKQYLLYQTEIKDSTIHEYTVRLRRLDALLTAWNFTEKHFSYPLIKQRITAKLKGQTLNNMQHALKQYQAFHVHQNTKGEHNTG